MLFSRYLEEMAFNGQAVNLMFEERLFSVVGILQKIAEPLKATNIPYEVIGGLAVLIHLEAADPSQSALTGDVDILIHRSDLDRAIAAAESGEVRLCKDHALHEHIAGNDAQTH